MAQQTFSGVPGDFTAGQVLTAAEMDKLREFLLYLIEDGTESTTGATSPLILDLDDADVQIVPKSALGNRNAIINGDFRINQRAFSSSASSVYGFDRWTSSVSGGTATYSSQSFTAGSPAATGYEADTYARLVVASQSAASDVAVLIQKIEDVRTYAGASVTLSFWAKAGTGTPKIATEAVQAFGSGGAPSGSVFTATGQVTLSTSWARYSVSFAVPSISAKTIGTDQNSSSLEVNLFFSAGTDFNSRTGSLGIQNNTFNIWGVQLERGAVATPFEQLPMAAQLELCQRYYEKSYDYDVAPGTASSYTGRALIGVPAAATGYISANAAFAVQKRANPNITIYDMAGTSGKVTYSANNKTGTAGDIGDHGFRVYSDNSTSKSEMSWQWVAEKEL